MNVGIVSYLMGIFVSLCVISCKKDDSCDDVKVLNVDVTSVDCSFDISSLFNIDGEHRLVKLETTEECVIGEVTDLAVKKGKIFITDNLTKSIYVFDLQGTFQYKIKNYGRAQNEYIDLTDVYVGCDDIYVLDIMSNKILVYSDGGKFKKKINISEVWGHNVFTYKDNLYLINKWSDSSNGLYRVFVLDKDGNINSTQLPFKKKDLTRYYSDKSAYAISERTVNLCFPSDNMIYTMNEVGKFVPYMFVDFNRQALPDRYLTYDLTDLVRDGLLDKYIVGIDRLLSSSRYLFIQYMYQSGKYTTIYDFKKEEYSNIKYLQTKRYFNLSLNSCFLTGDYLISYQKADSFKLIYEHVLKESLNGYDIYQSQVIDMAEKIEVDDNGFLVIHQLKTIDDD